MRRPWLVLAVIVLSACAVLTLSKAALILGMGEDSYSAGMALMQGGTLVDRAVGWLMGVDAATAAIVGRFM